MTEERKSILLVHAHTLFRSALAFRLNNIPAFWVTREASSYQEALLALKKELPHILLTDFLLPGRSGFDLIQEIQRLQLPLKVLVLSCFDNSRTVELALSAGAQGYVLGTANFEEFLAAVDDVAAGKLYLPPQFEHLRQQFANPYQQKLILHKLDPLAPLSEREREIFYLLADGLPNAVIAKKLQISPRTVETHRARIVRKLGVHSNAELIKFAIRHSLSAA